MSKRTAGLLILLLVIVVSIIGVIYFLLLGPSGSLTNGKIDELASEIKTGEAEYSNNIPKDRFDQAYQDLTNKSLPSSQRYQALSNIIYFFEEAYDNTNNPYIRKFIISLGPLAKQAFPRDYKDVNFRITCVDTTCGEKPDTTIKQIISDVKALDVDKRYTDTIAYNLNNASLVPYDTEPNKFDKIDSFKLSYMQLKSLKTASADAVANKLKTYVKQKYHKTL